MANKGMIDDPLRGGGAFDDQDMEDLTSHLANLPVGRGSHDGLDLGDNSELQGNMDRFRALAGDDSNDELFTSYGGLGLGLGVSDSTIITTTNYPTYGELAAAKPPSYEDSIMYEQAPLGIHAATAAAAAAAAAAGGGDDPLTCGFPPSPGGGAAAPSTSFPPLTGMEHHHHHHQHQQHNHQQYQQQQQAPPLTSTTNGGGAGGGAPWLGPLAAEPPPSAAAAGGPAGSGSSSGTGRGQALQPPLPAGGGGGGGLEPLLFPGSGDFRLDELQSPPLSPPAAPGPGPGPGPGQPPPPPAPPAGPSGAGRGSSTSVSSSAAAAAASQLITVSDPIKREQGGLFGIKGGYVTYLVRAKARPGGPNGPGRPETAVRRRFREFVALAELLKEKYRGYFVPPRPEKNAVEGQRMTDVFVEERRLALERYLNKLARHPVIGASEELRLFLEVDGELADSAPWLALRPAGLGGSVLEGTAKFSKQILGLDRAVTDPVQAAQPTKKATDFMRAIKETAQRMQSAPSAAASLAPDEAALVRAREEVEGLQGALTTASRAAEKLVSRLDRWSVVHGELGLALVALRNAEKSEGVALANHTGTLKQSGSLMHDTERLGTALVRSSRIGRKVTGRCAIELGCLHEYLGLMPAALKGLRARDKALLTADTLQSDLEGRRRAIAELEAAGARVLGGDAAKAKKVAELSGDVAVLEQSVVAARARYEAIKAVNAAEMGRLRSELRSDLGGLLHHYAAVMSACAQRNLEIWLQAASELGASPGQLTSAKACLVGAGAGAGAGPGAAQPPQQSPPQQ